MSELQSLRRKQGFILVADDQALMVESMRNSIQEIGLIDLTEFYYNGQDIINRVKELTEIALIEVQSLPVCPVRVLLLDF